MTVAELIEKLVKLDQSAIVRVRDGWGEMSDIGPGDVDYYDAGGSGSQRPEVWIWA